VQVCARCILRLAGHHPGTTEAYSKHLPSIDNLRQRFQAPQGEQHESCQQQAGSAQTLVAIATSPDAQNATTDATANVDVCILCLGLLQLEEQALDQQQDGLQKVIELSSTGDDVDAAKYSLLRNASAGSIVDHLEQSGHLIDEVNLRVQVCPHAGSPGIAMSTVHTMFSAARAG
jgi:hypothetical protein